MVWSLLCGFEQEEKEQQQQQQQQQQQVLKLALLFEMLPMFS